VAPWLRFAGRGVITDVVPLAFRCVSGGWHPRGLFFAQRVWLGVVLA
jgi:hypothetical protein